MAEGEREIVVDYKNTIAAMIFCRIPFDSGDKPIRFKSKGKNEQFRVCEIPFTQNRTNALFNDANSQKVRCKHWCSQTTKYALI